jgi:hypothetical protein
MYRLTVAVIIALLFGDHATICTYATAEDFTPQQLEFFENQIRPLLVEHCYECHSGGSKKLQAELRLDFREALLRGGDSGPSIVPGNADESLLIHSVRYESYEMPPKGKLADADIALLVRWINDGAPWPDEPPPESSLDDKQFNLDSRKASHWAWQPLKAIAPPTVKQTDWPASPIDNFILHKLEQAGLQPAPQIDRIGLIRRLSYDLIGLPPSPEQVDAFMEDTNEGAVERLVDTLLDSQHFGERWGRHWLDLVRYAESRGHEFDHDATNAYQYRDYVIRAFNSDIPYDQFVTEHIAGDLVEKPRMNDEHGFNESILGTGFWFLGEWVHSPVDIRKDEADRFDNMIDVMSKTFLGLTVACARCHDHKFDAITTADYYALTGFLQSSDFRQVRFQTIDNERNVADKLHRLDRDYQTQIGEVIAPYLPVDIQTDLAGLLENRTDQVAYLVSIPGEPAAGATTANDGKSANPSNLIDYATLDSHDYIQDGFIFGKSPAVFGSIAIDTLEPTAKIRINDQFAAVSDRFWDGLVSISENGVQQRGRLSGIPMSGRTLRSPTVRLDSGNIEIRARGVGHIVACVDSHRLIAGPLHNETVVEFNSPNAWTWVRMNLGRYVGHGVHFQFVPSEGNTVAVSMVAQDISDEKRAELEQLEKKRADAAMRLQSWVHEFIATADLPTASSTAAKTLKDLVAKWSTARSELRKMLRDESELAMAMIDSSGEDEHVLVRGNSSSPGPVVPRRYLSAIDGDDALPKETRSGRLELAQRINAPTNPQATRVIVNRIWHHLIGRGIVPTTDDFGVLGQLPTHPELLDYLADQFIRDGKSIKTMIRRIVLSKFYQMSSNSDPMAIAKDPKNRLWHYREPKRLDGESIRDSLLSISGRLDTKMYGPSVPVHLTAFMDGRGRPGASGPLDGDGRRSIYIAVRRNFLSPFMLTFDAPVPFSTMGRRNVSNVPAQSLILMNDPFVVSQAKLWATRVIAEVRSSEPDDSSIDPAEVSRRRIRHLYRYALSRLPTEPETELLLQFAGNAANTPEEEVSQWTDLAHALINTKEFIFLR